MGFFKKLHDKVTAPETNVELRFNSFSVALGGNLEGSSFVTSKEDLTALRLGLKFNVSKRRKS